MTVNFRNKSLFKLAFTHRSALVRLPKGERFSNERLEFLGDSILSFIVANYLYQRFPKKSEGELTSLRSLLVKTKTLAITAKKLGLPKNLILSKSEEEGGGRENEGILADCFESFVAAIFLDQGLAATENFIETNLLILTDEVEKMGELKDYKSLLQEKVQAAGHPSPVYRILFEIGPDHAKKFTAAAYDEDKKIGEGEGRTKQEAEINAAKNALGML